MFDGLVVSALSVLPRKRGAALVGVLARTGLSRLGVRAFAAAYGVDTDEAEHPISAYPTLEAFFTRRLKVGARPIDRTAQTIVSPVDGKVAFVGTTVDGSFEPEPGRALSLSALLGETVEGERDVAVLYLSPRDYHRVHAPSAGHVLRWRYEPGTLWPVFPAAARTIDGLLARNERLVAFVEHDTPWALVFVGAFGVGRIEVPFASVLSNDGALAADERCETPYSIDRGDEIGVFHLGSTVVAVWPAGHCTWKHACGDTVRMGAALATAHSNQNEAP